MMEMKGPKLNRSPMVLWIPSYLFVDVVVITHKYRGSIVVFSVSKSVKPNSEQKEMTRGFQQDNLCKY